MELTEWVTGVPYFKLHLSIAGKS